MKIRWEWLASLFPSVLAVGIVALLRELDLIDFHFSTHDLDTFIIFVGIFTTLLISSTFISRKALKQMQTYSLQQARIEASAEHIRFLRRLDHELKNPLMGIKVAIANLEETEDRVKRQKIASAIETQIVRMSRMIADLRKIADVEAQTLDLIPLDIRDLLQEIFTQIEQDLEPDERHLVLDLPVQALPVLVDRDFLRIAVHNLLSNAIKFTQNGDEIILKCERTGETAVIEVIDNGIGITPEELPYVWDDLFRSQTVKDIPGSGIGLALVKMITERHKGKAHIQSVPEQGTVVQITLPVFSDVSKL